MTAVPDSAVDWYPTMLEGLVDGTPVRIGPCPGEPDCWLPVDHHHVTAYGPGAATWQIIALDLPAARERGAALGRCVADVRRAADRLTALEVELRQVLADWGRQVDEQARAIEAADVVQAGGAE